LSIERPQGTETFDNPPCQKVSQGTRRFGVTPCWLEQKTSKPAVRLRTTNSSLRLAPAHLDAGSLGLFFMCQRAGTLAAGSRAFCPLPLSHIALFFHIASSHTVHHILYHIHFFCRAALGAARPSTYQSAYRRVLLFGTVKRNIVKIARTISTPLYSRGAELAHNNSPTKDRARSQQLLRAPPSIFRMPFRFTFCISTFCKSCFRHSLT
jgi:hypothetical protein